MKSALDETLFLSNDEVTQVESSPTCTSLDKNYILCMLNRHTLGVSEKLPCIPD